MDNVYDKIVEDLDHTLQKIYLDKGIQIENAIGGFDISYEENSRGKYADFTIIDRIDVLTNKDIETIGDVFLKYDPSSFIDSITNHTYFVRVYEEAPKEDMFESFLTESNLRSLNLDISYEIEERDPSYFVTLLDVENKGEKWYLDFDIDDGDTSYKHTIYIKSPDSAITYDEFIDLYLDEICDKILSR